MKVWHLGIAAALLALGGCAGAGSAANSVATAGIAATVGDATGSTLAGVAAGVGASVAVDQLVKYGERRIQGGVQNAVADAAGPLDVGQSAPWQDDNKLPFSGKAGTVEVARRFGAAIPCKDVVFTVRGDPDLYVTTVCKAGGGRWRWALAEPTVNRWGSLQ